MNDHDIIREKYDEFCKVHINGSYEKFKKFLKDYKVDDTSDEYRKLLMLRLKKMYENE